MREAPCIPVSARFAEPPIDKHVRFFEYCKAQSATRGINGKYASEFKRGLVHERVVRGFVGRLTDGSRIVRANDASVTSLPRAACSARSCTRRHASSKIPANNTLAD